MVMGKGSSLLLVLTFPASVPEDAAVLELPAGAEILLEDGEGLEEDGLLHPVVKPVSIAPAHTAASAFLFRCVIVR
jgi:hypothetical protein